MPYVAVPGAAYERHTTAVLDHRSVSRFPAPSCRRVAAHQLKTLAVTPAATRRLVSGSVTAFLASPARCLAATRRLFDNRLAIDNDDSLYFGPVIQVFSSCDHVRSSNSPPSLPRSGQGRREGREGDSRRRAVRFATGCNLRCLHALNACDDSQGGTMHAGFRSGASGPQSAARMLSVKRKRR